MAAQSILEGCILGVDYGEARIGLALASSVAKLPSPYKILANSEKTIDELAEIVRQEDIGTVVVGLPRNQSGEETAQTRKTRDFTSKLEKRISAKITLVDESLSTVRAEEMRKDIKDRVPGSPIDDLAACFILEEFLRSFK